MRSPHAQIESAHDTLQTAQPSAVQAPFAGVAGVAEASSSTGERASEPNPGGGCQ
jgi:hypothetical protein